MGGKPKTKPMPAPKTKSTFNSGFQPKPPADQPRLIILEDGTEVARTTMLNLQRDLDRYRAQNPDKQYKHVCIAVRQYGIHGSKYQQ
jgi:hypothetical protein